MSQKRQDYPDARKTSESDSAARSKDLNREMRTYLHTIIGYVEMLQEDVAAQGQNNFASELDLILTASNELAALVDERMPQTSDAKANMKLEPTAVSRENAGKWLRDRITTPGQQQG
ncbi:MAG: hypothetical protein O2913_04640 [Chloroflexi bacterium]|nr:hypothetical protein [Chloroflexota bacterium]